jgi:cytoplasmic iron level regulating protein YaaA (DUF328/UPF0246 family)
MQPYRLEMGTKIANTRGANLYDFWGSKLTDELNNLTRKNKSPYLVNLASNEYFKAVKKKELNADILTPVFKDYKNGDYKIISFFAKKARGLMVQYIVKNKITDVDDLRNFDLEGYGFDAKRSSEKEFVFTRKQV